MSDENHKPDEGQDFGAMLAAFENETAAERRPEPKVGKRVSGTILSIGAEFGFVDLGVKAEGVIPLEELCDTDGDLEFEVGDDLEVLVSGRDPSGSWLLRRRPGRGETLPEEIRAAQEHGLPVEGVVSEINKGGVEVQVAGLRGFCPISQLDRRYVEDPALFLNQRLQFRVTRFEPGAPGRAPNLVLSRRVLLEEEAARLAAETRARIEVGAVLTGTVSSIASFGAFVDLGGLEGLVHVSEMSYQRVEDPNEYVKVGQEVEVQVLKIERREGSDEERIALSLRALADDPWVEFARQTQIGATVQGQIVKLESFGAFVEVANGIQGLVHISELGQDRRLHHPRDAVSVGDKVEAKVLSIDLDKKRLSLSIGALREDAERALEAEDRQAYAARQPAAGSGLGSLADAFAQLQKKD